MNKRTGFVDSNSGKIKLYSSEGTFLLELKTNPDQAIQLFHLIDQAIRKAEIEARQKEFELIRSLVESARP